MRILVVARYKERGFAPFVTEQFSALQEAGIECRFFPIRSNGIKGYLLALPELNRAINDFCPDVIHAHYGICGLFANLQRRIPVVTTYHGSDINKSVILKLSKISIKFSSFNVFVSQRSIDLAQPKKDFALIPCGINLDDYPIMDKCAARSIMKFDPQVKYVLFAGAFNNKVKNAHLAKDVVSFFEEVKLLELKNYSRQQVAVLLQAVDALLMTSISEGSPQVIKEAMACGCPIVAVNVGDVKERLCGIEGCYVIDSRNVCEIAESLRAAFSFNRRTSGRERIIADGLENSQVVKSLVEIYRKVKK